MAKRKTYKRFIWLLLSVFILLNIIAFFHAYKFTHFSASDSVKTKSPEKLSTFAKVKTLITGVNNPRPKTKTPITKHTIETILLQSNKKIECWYIKPNLSADSVKGTIAVFHGYSGEKSSMMDKADEFLRLGYNTILVDFMGSGGSEGNQTTLGYKEAEQVKTVFDYLTQKKEKKIYLFGTSMGAAAILKAIKDYQLTPKAIILECPFGSMYQTTCARFRIMNAPVFPMAGLLVFWGGVQNGFWAFSHNPAEYAKAVTCPTLLLYGAKDKNVSRLETDAIFENLKGNKLLKIYPDAGHENYLLNYKNEWTNDITSFLKTN